MHINVTPISGWMMGALMAYRENHISYILPKYGLQDYKDMPKNEMTTGTDGDELLLVFFF